MINKTVTHVRQMDPADPSSAWLIDFTHDDGQIQCHGFPRTILGRYAAEYGIDPNDSATLLDIVLTEPYMGLSDTDPTFLYNTDQETARLHHLARVVQVRQQIAHLDPHDLLEPLRRSCTPTAAEYVEHIRSVRAHRSGNHAPQHAMRG